MYTVVLRLDPENAEAKEITTMMETGGGPSVVPTRPSQTGYRFGQVGETPAISWPKPHAASKKGQYAGAEAMLTQLLSREPGNPEICQLLARMHLLQGNLVVAPGNIDS